MIPLGRTIALSAAWTVVALAQSTATPQPAIVRVSTHFRAPLTLAAALERLDSYYDEQVDRRLAQALPELAANHRYEVWHDMWVDFEPGESSTMVTLQRATAADSNPLVKGWMLALAGRLEAPLPLDFEESSAMYTVEGEFWGSRRDAIQALGPQSGLQPIPTWQHAGLLVSTSPKSAVILAQAGLHGVHHTTVLAETRDAAKQLWSGLQHVVNQPCICAVYSEEAEFEEEVRGQARTQSDTLSVTASQALYVPQLDSARMEEKVREEPEMHKKSVAAQGQYSIKYRLDRPYRKIAVTWIELTGYNRADGKYTAERQLGSATVLNAKIATSVASPLTARTKLQPLAPGAYRVRLESDDEAGVTIRIDERTYWFDGKIFEEL